MTDALGICTSWGDGLAVVRRADDTEVAIPIELIVAGKLVPPRPLLRHRATPREAHVRAMAMFDDLQTEPLGGWVLRWSEGHPARRANSVLAMTATDVADPVARVTEHYRGLARRPIAAVLPDSPEETLFRARGWVNESPEPDSLFQLGGMALVRRNLTERPPYPVEVSVDGPYLRAVISGAASALGSLAHDWFGIRSVLVEPDARRRGYATAAIAALLDRGAELGAMTVYLQVLSDNEPALSLYERLGFTTHHAYRYLASPDA